MKIVLCMLDHPIRGLIESVLIESGYEVRLENDQSLINEEDEALRSWKLLIMEIEVIIYQANNVIPFLEKLRRLSGCKVLILSKPEHSRVIRNNELKVNHLVNHVLRFPLDKYELLENVKRYLSN